MNNEEKILSMLDKLTSGLQGFKKEVNERFDSLDQKVNSVEQKVDSLEDRFNSLEDKVTFIERNMVTKDDLHIALTESQADIKVMLKVISTKVDEQAEELDAKCAVLNDRLFSQEAQIHRLKNRQAL